MQNTVNLRQKCTICGQLSLPRVSWQRPQLTRDHITYQCKGSVGGGGGRGQGGREWVLGGGQGGRAWCGDLTFVQNLSSNSLPTGKSFHSNAQKFPELISFIRVATVREKSGKNENFSRSGKRLVDPSVHWTKKDSNIPSPGEQDHSNAPPEVQHKIKSPPHPMPCLTFCHLFQLNCMADRDGWYDLEWKTTDGINFILTNKGILLQYQSKTFGISLQSEFSFMWCVIQVEWKTLLLLVLKNILAICW